jgi:predicted ferric reductase
MPRRGGVGSPGALVLLLALVATTAAWLLLRPAGFGTAQYAGEVFGVLAVLCLSATLVLATRARIVEVAFGGLDRMYVWHRVAATAGLLLVGPHLLLVGGRDAGTPDPSSPALPPHYGIGNLLGTVAIVGLIALAVVAFLPRLGVLGRLLRLPYEWWLASHRLAGLLVAGAVVHGLFVHPAIRASAALWWVYLAIGAVGIGAYVARQVGDLRGWGRVAYVVSAVEELSPTTLEVRLRSLRSPIAFRAGQFVYASFGGQAYWEPHPFTISSAPHAAELRLSVRAGGDYTRRLHAAVAPGVGATIEGPYGGFHHDLGGDRQVWIAGGIGITPFLSWLADARATPVPQVDLFYAVVHAGDALYREELAAAAGRIPQVRVYLSVDDRDGRITAERIARTIDGSLTDRSVFLCGPGPMIRSLEQGLRRIGVPPTEVHYEEFSFR